VISFTPRPLYPQGVSVTDWIGGWVGPRAGLDAVVKRKIPSPLFFENLLDSTEFLDPNYVALLSLPPQKVLTAAILMLLKAQNAKRIQLE
jgi:hypothetical protein